MAARRRTYGCLIRGTGTGFPATPRRGGGMTPVVSSVSPAPAWSRIALSHLPRRGAALPCLTCPGMELHCSVSPAPAWHCAALSHLLRHAATQFNLLRRGAVLCGHAQGVRSPAPTTTVRRQPSNWPGGPTQQRRITLEAAPSTTTIGAAATNDYGNPQGRRQDGAIPSKSAAHCSSHH